MVLPGPLRRRRWAAAMFALLALSGAWAFGSRPGRRAPDPDRVARAETRMWKAYYSGNTARIAVLLVSQLRRQFGLTPVESVRIGFGFARSAMAFRTARGDYERTVLPLLVGAYSRLRRATREDFDPGEAARAELAWWVARRAPGQNSPEQVGRRIADLYGALYGGPCPAFERAGQLRAEAAALRDRGGRSADWNRIEALLRESHRAFQEGYEARRSGLPESRPDGPAQAPHAVPSE